MSNITFDKDGKPDIKSGEKTNIEKLQLKQHLIKATIIAKWKKEEKVNVFCKKGNKFIQKDEHSEFFTYHHKWDEKCEKDGTFIENDFEFFTGFIQSQFSFHNEKIFNLNFQLACDKYFDLMQFRNNAIEDKFIQKDLDVNIDENNNISIPSMRFHQFNFGEIEREKICPTTHEQMCKNEKMLSQNGFTNFGCQIIKQHNGKYYWDNSYFYFANNINLKYNEKYSIIDIYKKVKEKTYWVFVEHERVILPDKWDYKFISYSPDITIMPFIEYISVVNMAKKFYCFNNKKIKQFIADRLNYFAKQSYRDWYVL